MPPFQNAEYWFDWTVGLACSLVVTIMGGLGYGFREQLGPIAAMLTQLWNGRKNRHGQPEPDLEMAEAGRVRPNVAAAAAALQRNAVANSNNPFIY